jgi:hypothetical protein
MTMRRKKRRMTKFANKSPAAKVKWRHLPGFVVFPLQASW